MWPPAQPHLLAAVLVGLTIGGCSCFEPFPDCTTECPDFVPTANATGGTLCRAEGCVECEKDSQCRTACDGAGRCLPCDASTPCSDPSNACVAGVCRPCLDDAECETGQTCIDGRCGAPCVDNEACGFSVLLTLDAGSSTSARSNWFGCRFQSDVADRGAGVLFCSGQGYGALAAVCDPCLVSSSSVACVGCLPSGDCPCGATSQCPVGLVCRSGVCGSCIRHDDCTSGSYCLKGTCRPNCVDDSDCPGGRCDEIGHCRACLADDDCSDGKLCYTDGCVAPCTEDDDCLFSKCSETGRCGNCN